MRTNVSWRCCFAALLLVLCMSVSGQALAATTTYNSTDVPKALPDPAITMSTITIPCDSRILDVNVQLDIDHAYDDDLVFTLIAPDGAQILLAFRRGGVGDNYTGTVFDDEAATAISAGAAPFSGSYRPEVPLSGLDGRGAEGTWTLEIEDVAAGDSGTLNSWSLTITTDDNLLPSSDVPKGLPDVATTTSMITSCNTRPILDLNVQLDITHTYDLDLDIFLIAPDGTRVELSTNNGEGGDNYSGTIFDDEAATAITAGSAPFAESYQPETPLSVLDNMGADGVWTLEITDDAGADIGTLNSWSLIFTTVAPGYAVSTYAGGLPSVLAGLTVDQATRTFYYADFGSIEAEQGVLRKIDPDGTVSTVTTDFTPTMFFYPYIQTDIQFLNGSVYVPLSDEFDGELVKINTTTGVATSLYTFIGFTIESGIAAKNGHLLVSSGFGPATEIQSYNPVTDTAAVVLDVSPLTRVLNVEYDPAKGATYFWSDSVFYKADLGAGTYAAIPDYFSGYADFAVSPDGNFLFTANHPNIDAVTIADGSSVTVYSGLTDPARHDMVLAPSSTGGGCSLYVADGTGILEISGFPGSCKPFPWAMFLPAIQHGGAAPVAP